MATFVEVLTRLLHGLCIYLLLRLVVWVIADTWFSRKEQSVYRIVGKYADIFNKSLDKVMKKEK